MDAVLALRENISIHAPLAGCDSATVIAYEHATVFQSTHPLRGATKTVFGVI